MHSARFFGQNNQAALRPSYIQQSFDRKTTIIEHMFIKPSTSLALPLFVAAALVLMMINAKLSPVTVRCLDIYSCLFVASVASIASRLIQSFVSYYSSCLSPMPQCHAIIFIQGADHGK